MFGKSDTKSQQEPLFRDMSSRERRVYELLRTAPVGVLSMVDPNGEPHGVVIYFTIHKDLTISFLTKTETRKYDNLVRNDHVMLTVYDPALQATVQVTGRAHEVVEPTKVNAIAGGVLAASMASSDGKMPPISKLNAGTYAAFTILPVHVRMAVYADHAQGDYEAMFDSIESFKLPKD